MIISFDEFVKKDEEWDNYDAACSTYHEAAQYAHQRQDKYVYEWMKWNSCKGALEHFNMGLNDSGDMAFTGLNHELCGEWLADGAETEVLTQPIVLEQADAIKLTGAVKILISLMEITV